MSIILEGGILRIDQKTIMEIASLKGINLNCQIEENGIKIELVKEIFGMAIPIHIFIPEIEIGAKVLKIKNFKIMLMGMVLPHISILPFIKKYSFIEIDKENKILNINLKELIVKNFEYEIEKIYLKKGEIEIKIKNITLLLSDMVTFIKN